MKRSLRKRVAIYYVAVTGVLSLVVFAIVYFVVHRAVYAQLDDDLEAESLEVFKNMVTLNDRIAFSRKYEWEEGEHRQAEVNPIFLEVVGSDGRIIKKSANLKAYTLEVDSSEPHIRAINSTLAASPIRQIQLLIESPQGRTLGYLVIAMPREEADVVLGDLLIVLALAYPALLLAMFVASRTFAGRTLAPILNVIRTAEKITEENLKDRIVPPPTRDELYRLTATINGLLDRLQDALLREQQFTADAAHELITPLASLKGTLEVMIRNPREPEYYVQKIAASIEEVNRMSKLVDQLLTIARADGGILKPSITPLDPDRIVRKVIERMEPLLLGRGLEAKVSEAGQKMMVCADAGMLERMLENIVSNAIKFSPRGGTIDIAIGRAEQGARIAVSDHGVGMASAQTARVFDRFYRTDESRSAKTPGTGLGLAIVRRLADLQRIQVSIESSPGAGTTVTLFIPIER